MSDMDGINSTGVVVALGAWRDYCRKTDRLTAMQRTLFAYSGVDAEILTWEGSPEREAHPDGARCALRAFEYYEQRGEDGTPAIAAAVIAFKAWKERYLEEERRHAELRDGSSG